MDSQTILLIDINNGNNKSTPGINQHWHWTYAHGKLEDHNYNFDIPTFNKDMPTEEGYFFAYTEESKAVVINLVANEDGKLEGRCCYVDDYEALEYVNSPELWH